MRGRRQLGCWARTAARVMRPDRLRLVRVRGDSMRPTLADGDVLLALLRDPGEPLATGSVVVAQLPGGRGLGIKRLRAAEADGWWLERDNPARGSDSWVFGAVSDDAVLARALARVRPRPRVLLGGRAD